MSDSKPVPFDQILFQLFFDLVKSSGQGMNLDAVEKVRAASTRMAVLMDSQVQITCLGYLKTFQDNIKAHVDELEARLHKLEHPLPEASNTSDSHYKKLEKKVEALEAAPYYPIVDKLEKISDN